MNMRTEDEEDQQRAPLSQVQGEIEFENVSFEYDPGVPVLKNVSFTAAAGSTTALVGSSGSGKSTLISLAMNFNQPLSGTIRVDGKDLQSLRIRDFRSYLGVVMQDNFLFDGTIAENISFSNPHATIEEIQRVSKIAHVKNSSEVRAQVRHHRRRTWRNCQGPPADRDRAPSRRPQTNGSR